VAEKTGSAGSVGPIAQTLLPPLLRSGGPVTLVLRGGGEIRLAIQASPQLTGVDWQTAPASAGFRAMTAALRLPEHVARRQ
jgi:RNA 3'-terminal phosphate cyclase